MLAAALLMVGGMGAWPASAAQRGVSIHDFSFDPANVTINVGDSVRWTNDEGIGGPSHTATSDTQGQFDSGVLTPGQSHTETFNGAGTFAYHCSIHTSMQGTVVVQAPATTTTTRPPATTTRPAGTVARATTSTARATTSTTSTQTTETLALDTTSTSEETTSTTGDIAITTEDDGGVNGLAVAALVLAILGVLGGGGYALYRLRAGRF